LQRTLEQAGLVVRGLHSIDDALGHLRDERYDIILMEIDMDPDLEILRAVKLAQPDALVIFFVTGEPEPGLIRRAIEEGANGIVSKTVSTSALLHLLEVSKKGCLFCALDGFSYATLLEEQDEPIINDLDRQILSLIALGSTTSRVAQQLALSPSTVRNRLSRLYARLSCASRSEAVALALRKGWISVGREVRTGLSGETRPQGKS